MLRISKLADYAVLIMADMAGENHPKSASEIAESIGVSLPTVQKILKQLQKSHLLLSHRGADGGYCLTKHPKDICITEIITSIDGMPSLTECSHTPITCKLVNHCRVKNTWKKINRIVISALDSLRLSDMLESTLSTE